MKKGTPINKLKDKSGTQTVIQKIEDFINKYPKVKEDIESKFGGITNFALILSDKEKFKECFFGDYKKKYIAEDIEEIMVDYNENFSQEESKNIFKIIKNNISNLNNEKLEFHLHPIKKAENGYFSNVIKKAAYICSFVWKFGAMHASLGLNGMILEWDDSSLVWPTPDYQRIFNFSYEIKERFWRKVKIWFHYIFVPTANFFINMINSKWCLRQLIEKDLDNICETCVQFNKRRIYSGYNINCQFFVEEVLKSIGIELKFHGEMEKALTKLRKDGELDFSFKGKKFETRHELDNFVRNIDFYSLYEDEKKLLLLFKSTFEAQRLYKINDNGNFENFEDEKKFSTTDEAQEMWKQYELFTKI